MGCISGSEAASNVITFAFAIVVVLLALTVYLLLFHEKFSVDKKPAQMISFIIPFHGDNARRSEIFDWVLPYWRNEMPESEFLIIDNADVPFHKTKAINEGARQAHGDVFVIMDADCYMDPNILRHCVSEIRREREAGHKLWYIPYRRFFRLTEEASNRLLSSSPFDPIRFPDPPPANELVAGGETASSGHYWGALIQVMPREAFIITGGMDERFQGWGGEDVSFMHAVDTLWAKHKTYNGPVFHIWHDVIPGKWKHTRQWEGQPHAEMNDPLSWRYIECLGDKRRMRNLVNEGLPQ